MDPVVYHLILPLYVEPSSSFKNFLEDIGQPLNYPCIVQYWKGNLRFSSDMMLDEHKVPGREAVVDAKGLGLSEISGFASRFNSAMSIPKSDCDIFLKLIDDTNFRGAVKVLRATIVVKTLTARIALNNFFMLIEYARSNNP